MDPPTVPEHTLPEGITDEDCRFLAKTVELGVRGWGRVHPNPMVGCVMVHDGVVVGEGWHKQVGHPHAEINALADAGSRVEGSTVYVSLEPCAHFGRTPPCSSALADAGVARVVFGATDPGSGAGGADSLRQRGIPVDGPVFTPDEARAHNPAYFHISEREAPFVALKLAISLDGHIARSGERTMLTGPEAWERVHWLRAGFDGIMVGSNTVRIDDPSLTVRGSLSPRRPPARIVLDSRADLPLSASLFEGAPDVPVVVFTRLDTSEERLQELEGGGAAVHPVPDSEQGIDLGRVLEICGELGVTSILCEGGGVLASSLLREERIGRIYLFIAPVTVGNRGVPAFPGPFSDRTWERWRPIEPPSVLGRDTLLVLDRIG